jgi:hypothetical protein
MPLVPEGPFLPATLFLSVCGYPAIAFPEHVTYLSLPAFSLGGEIAKGLTASGHAFRRDHFA